MLVVQGTRYHVECFCCTKCSKPVKQYFTIDKQYYCLTCGEEKKVEIEKQNLEKQQQQAKIQQQEREKQMEKERQERLLQIQREEAQKVRKSSIELSMTFRRLSSRMNLLLVLAKIRARCRQVNCFLFKNLLNHRKVVRCLPIKCNRFPGLEIHSDLHRIPFWTIARRCCNRKDC